MQTGSKPLNVTARLLRKEPDQRVLILFRLPLLDRKGRSTNPLLQLKRVQKTMDTKVAKHPATTTFRRKGTHEPRTCLLEGGTDYLAPNDIHQSSSGHEGFIGSWSQSLFDVDSYGEVIDGFFSELSPALLATLEELDSAVPWSWQKCWPVSPAVNGTPGRVSDSWSDSEVFQFPSRGTTLFVTCVG